MFELARALGHPMAGAAIVITAGINSLHDALIRLVAFLVVFVPIGRIIGEAIDTKRDPEGTGIYGRRWALAGLAAGLAVYLTSLAISAVA